MNRPVRPAMRLRLLAAAVTLPVAGVTLAAPAAADDSYPVPASGQLELRGHGYGHGHGLSQYGAEGAARLGKSWRRIVGFYYPGTRLGSNAGSIRVLITADTSSDVVVRPTDGLTVLDRGTGRRYRLPVRDRIDAWRLTPAPTDSSATVLQRHDHKGWHRVELTRSGMLRGTGEFRAERRVALKLPSGEITRYRGALRSAYPSAGSASRDTVNVLSMDDYVRGVVPLEMPASWSQQALRAQAVAARTYASYMQRQRADGHYQICDTTSCQVYGGASAEQPSTNKAVRGTAGRILTYGGRPAFTQFNASSGGWTSAGSQPYLAAKADPWDDWAGNPVHSWTATIDTARLENTYPRLGRLERIRVTRRDGHGQWGGRILTAVLVGSSGRVQVTGDTLRWAYGLRSTWWTAG